jgi:hypothetical protein
VEHSAYSLHLSSCGFSTVGPRKQALPGFKPHSDAQLKQVVFSIFKQQHLEFFEKGIQHMVAECVAFLNT